ncbi:MAG TPA: hypothetical protein PLC39_01430 [Methanomassiliicoccales archaeon]|nr:hypothetical protein [Methanomassiliicoccales archaeon]HNX47625.1 hypothetical protein [Methanomassiliicoccales archaeon]HPR97946.1 hypothetical protein [Methanomassiliicoccales archaeon]
MDRKSSFKECPKCGLRNKPGAAQCDFCGQNLTVSDDWQQHIKDLESLNKMELRKPLDDRTSKRIESTIVRKDPPASKNGGIKEAGNIGKALKDLDEPSIREERPRPAPAQEKFTIREAGNIGKALKDLDEPSVREERPRPAPAQDHKKIKETVSAPLANDEPKVEAQVSAGSTIADLLREPSKESPMATPPAEPQVDREVPSLGPSADEVIEETNKEPVELPPLSEVVPEPEKADAPSSVPMTEPQTIVKPEGTRDPEPRSTVDEEAAKEVPVANVQTVQKDIGPNEAHNDEKPNVPLASDDKHETIKLKLVEVERPKEKLVPITVRNRFRSSGMAAIVVLGLGIAAYLVVLTMTALGILGTVEGLGGGAVSSLMIIYGASVTYPALRKEKGTDVYMCPKCHEKVEKRSHGCPACGAEFENED